MKQTSMLLSSPAAVEIPGDPQQPAPIELPPEDPPGQPAPEPPAEPPPEPLPQIDPPRA